MEANALFAALGILILLAATSVRFGADSREGFASKERQLAAGGFAWTASPARDRFLARQIREAREHRQAAA